MENRIIVPETQGLLAVRGMWEVEHWRKGRLLGRDVTKNLICNEGLNFALNVLVHGQTLVDPWYIGIFEGNYTPVATVTAATVAADSTESTAYNESVRQTFLESAAAAQSTSNAANRATFTINASKTIYGGFLASASAKSATTGTLLAIARFATSRAVIAADLLLVTYTLTVASV